MYAHELSFTYFPPDSPGATLSLGPGIPTSSGLMKRVTGLVPGLSSIEIMQKSVMNAFSLKYSESNPSLPHSLSLSLPHSLSLSLSLPPSPPSLPPSLPPPPPSLPPSPLSTHTGCQIILTKDMEGMELALPRITRNFYVDGHVPQPH